MDAKEAKSRKRVYGFIAIALVLCISLSVFLSLEFGASAPIRDQEETQPEASTPPNQVTDGNAGDKYTTAPDASTSAANSQNASLITEDEAISIATPLIEQYAKENNRTITTVNATFYAGLDWQPKSVWEIRAKFVDIQDLDAPQHWIIGYCVWVWADNGEIQSASEEGIM